MNYTYNSRRIKILRDTVALRIAAGEVIDRPFSVVRELMDNAIDSSAEDIDLHIDGGGLERIRVIDNGCGMDPDDLKICYLPHSTSKIREIEDLDRLYTLGFRGEALSSIASCSRLEIVSAKRGGTPHRIVIDNGRLRDFSPFRGNAGTMASVYSLFHEMPARRKFLKRPASEAAACRKTFIEKALPFHDRSFRYYQDGNLKLFFPKSLLKERILNAYPGLVHKDLIHESKLDKDDFSLTVVAADPSFTRKDRRFIQIFLNNRKISDFSLIQAIEYGFSEFLPGGTYPVAFLFITINPSLVDFNIHPAKKEVRIRNSSELHHEIVNLIKSFLKQFTYGFKESISVPERPAASAGFLPPENPSHSPYIPLEKRNPGIYGSSSVLSRPPDYTVHEIRPSGAKPVNNMDFIYMGQVFNLFLMISANDSVYFIDQHAAHEKILFNSFIEKPSSVQELLIPRIFTADKDADEIIKDTAGSYRDMGIIIEKLSEEQWALKGVPESCAGFEDTIVEFIKKQQGTVKDLKTALYADMACKSAIKDGEVIDSVTATELIRKTLQLENARCPHGRPIWFQISKDELFKLVGRT